MKNILKKPMIAVITLLVMLVSCNSEDSDFDLITDKPIAESNNVNVTIQSGLSTTKIVGTCVWQNLIEESIIVISDKNNSKNQFIISLPFSKPPTKIITYTIVENATKPIQVDMVYSEYKANGLLQWYSSNKSGNFTLVVEDNKITITLNGIILLPRKDSLIYPNLNIGEFANPGILSGTFTFDTKNKV